MNGISLPLQLQNVSFILLSIAFGIIAILFAYHKKYAKELVLSVISQRYANHYLRDDNVFSKSEAKVKSKFELIKKFLKMIK